MSTGTDSIDYRYLLKLTGSAIILQVLGWTISTFPFFQFFAFVPLIALCGYLQSVRSTISRELFTTLFIAFLIPAGFKFLAFPPSITDFIASISPLFAFLFWYYSGIRLGKLKSFYLVIFWLGIEYIFILIKPSTFNHLPGAAFRLWGESFVWIKYTGFQGTTFWLVITNILFANSFFTNDGRLVDRLSRSKFFIASLAGVLPMILSMLLYEGNPAGDLTPFYTNPVVYRTEFNFNPFFSYYLDYGEYLGKTSFWLSILLILSLMVRGFLKPDGNKN